MGVSVVCEVAALKGEVISGSLALLSVQALSFCSKESDGLCMVVGRIAFAMIFCRCQFTHQLYD